MISIECSIDSVHVLFNRNSSPQETFSVNDNLCRSFISHLVSKCIGPVRSVSHGPVRKIDPTTIRGWSFHNIHYETFDIL